MLAKIFTYVSTRTKTRITVVRYDLPSEMLRYDDHNYNYCVAVVHARARAA